MADYYQRTCLPCSQKLPSNHSPPDRASSHSSNTKILKELCILSNKCWSKKLLGIFPICRENCCNMQKCARKLSSAYKCTSITNFFPLQESLNWIAMTCKGIPRTQKKEIFFRLKCIFKVIPLQKQLKFFLHRINTQEIFWYILSCWKIYHELEWKTTKPEPKKVH